VLSLVLLLLLSSSSSSSLIFPLLLTHLFLKGGHSWEALHSQC
jgi:hypothetical protein